MKKRRRRGEEEPIKKKKPSRLLGFWKSISEPEEMVGEFSSYVERDDVSSYLRSGRKSSKLGKKLNCIMCGKLVTKKCWTDGKYSWTNMFLHAVEEHAVVPPQPFISYVMGKRPSVVKLKIGGEVLKVNRDMHDEYRNLSVHESLRNMHSKLNLPISYRTLELMKAGGINREERKMKGDQPFFFCPKTMAMVQPAVCVHRRINRGSVYPECKECHIGTGLMQTCIGLMDEESVSCQRCIYMKECRSIVEMQHKEGK